MTPSPESIEKLVHDALRTLRDRHAPDSLQARVLAAVTARAARPWWRRPFARWPLAASGAGILVVAGLAKAVSLTAVWALARLAGGSAGAAFAFGAASAKSVGSLAADCGEWSALLLRAVPSFWLYGGLAVVTALYLVLFGLGATVYRTLYARR